MMIDHRMLNLFGKKIFERAVMKAPFRVPVSMPNEACFYFMVRGRGEVIGSGGSFQSEEENGFVLRCGNCIRLFSPSGSRSPQRSSVFVLGIFQCSTKSFHETSCIRRD